MRGETELRAVRVTVTGPGLREERAGVSRGPRVSFGVEGKREVRNRWGERRGQCGVVTYLNEKSDGGGCCQ